MKAQPISGRLLFQARRVRILRTVLRGGAWKFPWYIYVVEDAVEGCHGIMSRKRTTIWFACMPHLTSSHALGGEESAAAAGKVLCVERTG